MEYRIYTLAYELLEVVYELPENTEGLHIEQYDPITGNTTIIKTVEPE